MNRKFEIEAVKKINFEGQEVLFAISDGSWLNATKVAKANGKRLDKFWELAETKAYMEALTKSISPITGELKHSAKGRYGGTYIHPQLVLYFAQWISPEFHIKCNQFIEYEIKAEANAIASRLREEKERMSHQHKVKLEELDAKREECEAKVAEYNKQMQEQKEIIMAATSKDTVTVAKKDVSSTATSSTKSKKPAAEKKTFGSVSQWLKLRLKTGDINKMSLKDVFDALESKEVRKVTHEKIVTKKYRILDATLGADTSSGINVDFAEMDKIFFGKARKHAEKTKGDKPEHKCKGECKGKGKCKNKPKGDEVESKRKGPPVEARVMLVDEAKGNLKARKEAARKKLTAKNKAELKRKTEAKPVKPNNPKKK